MTLTGIPVGAENGRRLGGRAEAETADLSQNCGWRGSLALASGRLDDRHQLALQRTVIPVRAFAQTLDDVVGRIPDRKIDRHGFRIASGMEAF